MKLSVRILDIDEHITDFHLSANPDGTEWKQSETEYAGPDFLLIFYVEPATLKIKDIKKGPNIRSTDIELRQQFSELLFEESIARDITEKEGFDNALESETENFEKFNPYNPKLIRVDQKNFSIFQINQMIQNGDIDLTPDFQRHFVWNDITRKSRLIESLLLRIPLPVFYFAQDEEGLFQVVDGVQRLTVIHSFINNEFRLKNLEYLSECEGKWYNNPSLSKDSSLNNMYIRRIDQSQLFINIIDPQTPSKVKYDIFKRINTGGKALNNQEIRNCLAAPRTRTLLRSLSQSEEFLTATKGSISPVRMADEELILRFIAFYLIDTGNSTIKEYRGGMDEVLDETVNILSTAPAEIFSSIRKNFVIAMTNSYSIFGDNTFRKVRNINKSLFLGLSRILRKYSCCEVNTWNKKAIQSALQQEIESNYEFSNALSMATNDARNIFIVYRTLQSIIKNNIS